MIKKILLIGLLMFINLSYAQAIYKIDYLVKIDFVESNSVKEKYLKIAQQGAEKLSFSLYTDNTNALFKQTNVAFSNSKEVKLALAWVEYSNPIYTNLKSKTNYYFNRQNPFFNEKEFLISNPIFSNWVLVNETKVIQGLTCYKATANVNQSGLDWKVVAWYCPEIPLGFGPLGFGSLPGVILELQMNEVLYGATKIQKLSKLDFDINVPENSKTISQKEYEERLNKHR